MEVITIDENETHVDKILEAPTVIDDEFEKEISSLNEQLLESCETPDNIVKFFHSSIPILSDLPKAKAAKVVRSWVDEIATVKREGVLTRDVQLALCKTVIEWAETEKRSFLKHRVQVKLGWIYLEGKKMTEGMELIEKLSYEVKKLEEKVLLVEIYLIQSKMFFEIKNVPRAKAALTASRANANSVHVSALLQAQIEFTGGELAAAEKEYNVAHSYFQEAYDGFVVVKNCNKEEALSASCMFLMKLMELKSAEFDQMAKSKTFLELTSTVELSSVLSLGEPIKNKDLKKFLELRASNEFLSTNPIMSKHLVDLEELLLGEVIVKVLGAYSRCEISYISESLNLDHDVVHRKLIKLILDGKLNASLAEDEGVITIEEPERPPKAMQDALQTIKNLGEACDVIELIAQKPREKDSSKAVSKEKVKTEKKE